MTVRVAGVAYVVAPSFVSTTAPTEKTCEIPLPRRGERATTPKEKALSPEATTDTGCGDESGGCPNSTATDCDVSSSRRGDEPGVRYLASEHCLRHLY